MTYRIDLSEEKQRAIEAAAARMGVDVEAFIVRGAEVLAQSTTQNSDDVDAIEVRKAAQRARVAAVRGKFAHLKGTVDDLLRERHEQAMHEMQRDSS